MSASKRPSATVASFRNNVEEDFTVSPPHLLLPALHSPVLLLHNLILFRQLFTVRCQIQNEVWQVEKRYSMFDSIHRKLQVRTLDNSARNSVRVH